MGKGLIVLDVDGVLLDYGLAYVNAWQKAFGIYSGERDPLAFWPKDRGMLSVRTNRRPRRNSI